MTSRKCLGSLKDSVTFDQSSDGPAHRREIFCFTVLSNFCCHLDFDTLYVAFLDIDIIHILLPV